jgi:transposase InsO family protein
MSTEEVKQTIEAAIGFTSTRNPTLWHRPRLLSDNGPCYVSKALREYLEAEGIHHSRGKPYHPMTQGKIERYHRSMKNLLLLEHYHSPLELEHQIGSFVNYYNNYRYHEAQNNVTPADVYYGRKREILSKREQIKKNTMSLRRRQNYCLRIA